MKILNRILSILILLAAITSAVFSFGLYLKRNQMVQVWSKLAEELQNTAMVLDKESGTKYVDSVAKDKLLPKAKLKEPKELLSTLDAMKLAKDAQAIIAQRNSLANQMVAIAKTAGVKDAKVADLKKVSSYVNEQERILKNTRDAQKRYDNVMNQYRSMGQKLKVPAPALAQLKDNPSAAADYRNKLNSSVDRLNGEIRKLTGAIQRIASSVRVPSNPDANVVASSVIKKVNELNQNLAQTKRSLQSKTAECNQKQQQIVQLQKTCVQKDAQINKWKADYAKVHKLVNKTNSKELDKLLFEPKTVDDFKKLYKMLEGRISYIDKDWGFVIIDVPKPYQVKYKLAGESITNVLTLPQNEKMSVIRDFGTKNSKMVGKVHLTEVYPTYAVADIKKGEIDSFKVGDVVIFNDVDVQQVIKNKESTKKVAPVNSDRGFIFVDTKISDKVYQSKK